MVNANKSEKPNIVINSSFWWIVNIILLCAIVFSAFFMVYLKDVYRRDFIDYQRLQNQAAELQIQYNQLLLEESTWASESRIQRQATKKLNMMLPKDTEMIVTSSSNINPSDLINELANG